MTPKQRAFVDSIVADALGQLRAMSKRQPNRVYESMTRCETPYHVVRVWRTEGCLAPEDNSDIYEVVESASKSPCASDMVHALEKLPRVAAIEVLDRITGNGVLLYPDWS